MTAASLSPLSASDFFPLRYRHAAWAPFLALTAAAFNLERTLSAAPGALWEGLGHLSCLFLLLPPIAPAARNQDGYLRRVMIGYSMLLLAWLLADLLAPSLKATGLAPSLCAAGVLLAILGTWKLPGAFQFSLLCAILATLIAALASGKQQWAGVALGLLAGGLGHCLVFAHAMDFLDNPRPWQFGFNEFRALFIENRRDYWEDNYAAGNWRFLESANEKPRHYAIAGIVHDRFREGADILDIGCGYGTLYPLLSPRAASYMGVDLAQVPIEECRTVFKDDPRCRFEACSFEDFHPKRKFDVVILNEVLYYFPIGETEAVFRRAMRLLKGPGGVLIISTGLNPKAAWTRHRLSRLAVPAYSQIATNAASGSSWTVSVYQESGKRS